MDFTQIIRAIRDWCISKFQLKGDYAATGDIQVLNDKISAVNGKLTASDGSTFRYGVTEDGKPGCIITDEEGADTVVPFSSGTGVQVNGIIKEYYASTSNTVSAGDFVKYAKDFKIRSNTLADTCAYDLKMTAIDNERVICVYTVVKTEDTMAVILHIVDGEIVLGEPQKIAEYIDIGEVTLIDKTRVLITYGKCSEKLNWDLAGVICSIEEDSIAIGEEKIISTAAGAGARIYAAKIADNKVFIAHLYNLTNRYLYSIVVTVDGTTITNGSDTALVTTSGSAPAEAVSITTLEENKVLITMTYGSTFLLYGIVCTVSGTVITKGTLTKLNTEKYMTFDLINLFIDTNHVLICHGTNNGDGKKATLCEISNKTISVLQTADIATTETGNLLLKSAGKLGEKVILDYGTFAKTLLVDGDIIKVDNESIELPKATENDTDVDYTAVYMDGKMIRATFNMFSSGTAITNYIIYINAIDKVISSEDAILGIAKTMPDNEGKLEVYVPEMQTE